MGGKTIPVLLEVDAGTDPIQGSLRVRDEAPRRFWGWLELSGLLLGIARPGHHTAGAMTNHDDRMRLAENSEQ